MAVIMVLGIVISLSIYAVYTKRDFSIYGGALFMISFLLINLE